VRPEPTDRPGLLPPACARAPRPARSQPARRPGRTQLPRSCNYSARSGVHPSANASSGLRFHQGWLSSIREDWPAVGLGSGSRAQHVVPLSRRQMPAWSAAVWPEVQHDDLNPARRCPAGYRGRAGAGRSGDPGAEPVPRLRVATDFARCTPPSQRKLHMTAARSRTLLRQQVEQVLSRAKRHRSVSAGGERRDAATVGSGRLVPVAGDADLERSGRGHFARAAWRISCRPPRSQRVTAAKLGSLVELYLVIGQLVP